MPNTADNAVQNASAERDPGSMKKGTTQKYLTQEEEKEFLFY